MMGPFLQLPVPAYRFTSKLWLIGSDIGDILCAKAISRTKEIIYLSFHRYIKLGTVCEENDIYR